MMFFRGVMTGGVIAVCLVLTACATATRENDEYKRSISLPPFKVPGDLALPPGDPGMEIPAPPSKP